MTVVEKIRLKGFKSFAKPIDLEFGSGFNCIIGPNGSGKSNIMDALTFVLGKTSAKSMRAEKSSNLIYNGGKAGSPMREAEVAIYFSNKEKEFPLAQKTVKISRVVRQSGTSQYLINDEKRTRQQIVDLLSKAQIDPDGFNIVLQGDIVLFTEMKPDDRRLMIEDISGISLYEDKKQKALLELDKVDQKLNDAGLIMKEREAHLRELRKERDQALKVKEIETSIKESKATYLYLQIKQKKFKQEGTDSRIKKQQSNLSSIEKKIKELKEKIKKKNVELENINKEIEEKGEVEQLQLQQNIESLREKIIKDSTRLDTITSEVQKIRQRIQQLNKDRKELKLKIQNLNEEHSMLGEEIVGLKRKEQELSLEVDRHKKKHDISSIEKLEGEIEGLQHSLMELRERKGGLGIDQERIGHELKSIEEQIERFSSPLVKKKLGELSKLEKELDDLVNKLNVTSSVLEGKATKLDRLKLELSDLQGNKIRITQALSGNMGVKTVLKAKIKGVYGTIASLGKVDERYSTALEVAAAGRINSLVVDSDSTASKCIQLLKEKRTGIGTFLPLNKLQLRNPIKELEQLKNFSGVKDIALKLIKYDKRFEKAFSYVFGSTLVIDDITVARKVGIGRVRMVTLEGDIVEPSGAMIGGYRRKTVGVFEQKEIDEKIEQKEKDIKSGQKEVSDLAKERKEGQEVVSKLMLNKAVLEADIEKLQHGMEVHDLKGLKGKQSEFISQRKTIQKEIDSLIREEKSLVDKIEKLRVRRKPKSAEEHSAGEEKEVELSKIREKIIQKSSEMKNIDNQISSIHSPEEEKILEIVKQHEKELKEFEEESKKLDAILKEKKPKLGNYERKEKKFRENYKSLFTKRNKVSEDIRDVEGKISQEDFKAREVEKKMNEVSLDRAKIVAELEALEAEFEPFIGTKLRKNISQEDLRSEIKSMEKTLASVGNVNMKALEMYDVIEKEFEELKSKKESLVKEKDAVLVMMAEIEGKKKRIFLKTYKQISGNFTRIFSSLSTKGEAYLDLEDKENPLAAGINIKVKLAGTKYLDLHSLSGGEKTLTSLALIFAIQEYQPASFYLLDEIDAALDKTNSALLSQLVKQYAKVSQVVLISHNDQIITESDQIYGVSMQQNGISKVISMKI